MFNPNKSSLYPHLDPGKVAEARKYKMAMFKCWSRPTYYLIIDEDYNIVYRGQQLSKFSEDPEFKEVLKAHAHEYNRFNGFQDVISFVQRMMILDGVINESDINPSTRNNKE